MLRAGNLTSLAVGLAGLAGAFALLAPGVAVAAPGDGGPVGIAALAQAPKSFTDTYSCDLSAFGTHISPVSVSATLSFPASVQVGRKLAITLKTASVTLPSSVLSQLAHVVSFDLSAAVTVRQGNSLTVPLKGKNPVSGTLAGLPAGTATGSVLFTDPGKATVKVPAPKLDFTPRTSAGSGTTPPDITCTTTAAAKDISVTVSPPAGTTGPLYECAVTAFGITEKILVHFPMSITSSGTRKTGSTDTVTLVIPDFGPFSPGTSSVKFTSSLQVLGAQPGTIALSKRITDISAATARVPGKFALTKTGTDRILIPKKFTLTFKVSSSGVTVSLGLSCTIHMSHIPVGLTIKVTKGHPQPSPTPTNTNNGGQGQGNGTPNGAPSTGGGAAPGTDLAAAAGGLAMVASGGGLVLLGGRRRRRGDAGPAGPAGP
jgi:hypothetical protein